jgi:hypothetical protein
MDAAMVSPKLMLSSKNRIELAFALAVSARGPSRWPIQAALIDAFSDCRILVARIGSEKAISVRAIGPSTRLAAGRLRGIAGPLRGSGVEDMPRANANFRPA